MEDLVSTAPGDVSIVGSKLNPEAKQGQNGGLNPSAIQTNGKDFQGKPLPYSTVAQSIKRANKAQFIPPDDPTWQNRKVSAAPIKAHPGMVPDPNASMTSGKVPMQCMHRSTQSRYGAVTLPLGYGGAVKPSSVKAKPGNFKR